jgi:hypothetical protein
VQYQTTLRVVQDTAVEAEVEKSVCSESSQHLHLIVADTIDAVEETVQDSIQDYEADVELDTQVAEIAEKIKAKETGAGEEKHLLN